MDSPQEKQLVWIWRIGGVLMLVVINFISSAYYAGGMSTRIDSNERRIKVLEDTQISRDAFQAVRDDVKDIKGDVKEILKGRR